MPSRRRVLVVGLAEATLKLIRPWSEAGYLPTFRRLIQEGTSGNLHCPFPTITPQIWATIVTGRTPGHHGLFDFWQRGSDGRFKEMNGSWVKAKPIWSLLDESGLNCGIVNVPFTYPPRLKNGFMISGEDAPGSHRSIASPSSLYDEIVRRFGRYHLKDIFPGGRKKADYLNLIQADVKKQTDVFEYLISEKNWDFFLVFYSATAIAQHYFWADMESEDKSNLFRDVVLNAYRAVDTALERLMNAAGSHTTVFVISEFGAGPLKSGIQVNTWLEREGFLARKIKETTSKNDHFRYRFRSMIANIRKNVQGRLPPFAYFVVNQGMRNVKAWIQSYLTGSDFDWSKTQAFCRGKEGNIFINLKGRESKGIVNPGSEYDSLRTRIIERLKKLVDPKTGQGVVDCIYRREELYKGPMLDRAPDLIVYWKDGAYMPTENDREMNSIFVTRWREYMDWPTTGGHNHNGILIVSGPTIKTSQEMHGANVLDLLPTWLKSLDQKIPLDLEGEVLENLFESAHLMTTVK